MARPKQDNAEYFSHDKNMRNDPKVKALRRKFLEGYAVYSMLLETLTAANFFVIDLTPIQIELMAGDFDVESEVLEEIITYCVKIELLIKEENRIFSSGLKKRLQPVLDHRNRSKEKFLKQKQDSEIVSAAETTQSKVKESKVKESIKEVVEEENQELENFEKIEDPEILKLPDHDVFIDEEEKAAAVSFLKSNRIWQTIQMQEKIDGSEVLKLFDIFYLQKLGFNELKGKTRDDVVKNFYYWIPKYKNGTNQKIQKNDRSNNQKPRVTTSADDKRADRKAVTDRLRGLLQGTEPK